jgi:hypothetical protein
MLTVYFGLLGTNLQRFAVRAEGITEEKPKMTLLRKRRNKRKRADALAHLLVELLSRSA